MTRILIAEDEPGIASFVAKGLRTRGFVAEVAGDGRDALARARSGDIDLLVLDLGLPGLDGLAVLRALRLVQPMVPVVVITARKDAASTASARRAGADAVLAKPFRFGDLLAAVRDQLPLRPATPRPERSCAWPAASGPAQAPRATSIDEA